VSALHHYYYRDTLSERSSVVCPFVCILAQSTLQSVRPRSFHTPCIAVLTVSAVCACVCTLALVYCSA
jgi:hypothetical protein